MAWVSEGVAPRGVSTTASSSKRGISTVNFVSEWFESLAETTMKANGLPDLNTIIVPLDIELLSEEQVIAIADREFEGAVAAITARELVTVLRRSTASPIS
ncbi:MAG: hypothetical protein Q7O66_23600 [Dehalococcoidia bacterium]|nr:hypothetical protein [Dehalococcoidia bacterium]